MKKIYIIVGLIVFGAAVYLSPSIYKIITASAKKAPVLTTMSVKSAQEIVAKSGIDSLLTTASNIVGLISGIAGLGLGADHVRKTRKARKTTAPVETPKKKKAVKKPIDKKPRS